MTRITGRQARNLLDGTTPGPWVWDQQLECVVDPPYSLADLHINAEGNGELIAAAPELAETVAWLYGREPNYEDGTGRSEWHLEPFNEVVSVPGAVIDIDGREHSPDGAIEYARALLVAADKARP